MKYYLILYKDGTWDLAVGDATNTISGRDARDASKTIEITGEKFDEYQNRIEFPQEEVWT